LPRFPEEDHAAAALAKAKNALIESIDSDADKRDFWKRKNRYYHEQIEKLCALQIPAGSAVLEIGCSTGGLLAALKPSHGVGLDLSPRCIEIAQARYPTIAFHVDDAENLSCQETFDYVVMSDVLGYFFDVWKVFRNLRRVTHRGTRIVLTYYNAFWEPWIRIAQWLRIKAPQEFQNWLSLDDIENQLQLNGYEVIRRGHRLLLPFRIPLLSSWVNRYVAAFPGFKHLCLIEFIVARERGRGALEAAGQSSCSVIIPCRNEAGNIEEAVQTVPRLGRHTEILFVDGNSTDGTQDIILKQMELHRGKIDIKLIHQGEGRGKGDAVRRGFAAASGDYLFILDADLTVPAVDLIKFYQAMDENEGEFINGTRLVYPMEEDAMRSLNLLGNKVFSLIFTWLLDQRIKDTLCGTKAISKKHYDLLAANRSYFGDFDPFGDFDLLFGSAKLNLKIVEIAVRYRARTYGDTKISRFRHGWLLLRMCGVALRKLKLQ